MPRYVPFTGQRSPAAYNFGRQEDESMNARCPVLVSLLVSLVPPVWAAGPPPANPAIDMAEHLRVSMEAARHRDARRVSEEKFIRMSRQAGTVILDARSREKYEELHVK